MAQLTVESPTERAPRRAQRYNLAHSEVLAPVTSDASPETRRRATRALAVFGLLLLLVQVIATPLGRYLESKVYSGTDAYSEWAAYAAGPPPDVLFLGPSEARTDIDVDLVSQALSAELGRHVTVGKMGFSSQAPDFLELVLYRITHRAERPKVIVRTLETPMFNANGTCAACLSDAMTSDTWLISDVTNAGFDQLALRNNGNPSRLVAGWLVPALAYYPAISAADCSIVRRGRVLTQQLLGQVPWELEVPTPCALGSPAHPDQVMNQQNEENISRSYRDLLTRNYAISPQLVRDERESVRMAQAAGIRVLYLKPPFHSLIRDASPEATRSFERAVQSLAADLDAPILDLSTAMPDDRSYWVDPLHLNRAGAARLAPHLAGALAGVVGAG